jgi:NhaP-type Na+/H+ or K+/H+ antiporter
VITAAAVVLNVALALLLRAVTGTSGDFTPLQPGPVAVVTLIGVLAGLLVHMLLRRLTTRPDRLFAALVVIGALLSLGGHQV